MLCGCHMFVIHGRICGLEWSLTHLILMCMPIKTTTYMLKWNGIVWPIYSSAKGLKETLAWYFWAIWRESLVFGTIWSLVVHGIQHLSDHMLVYYLVIICRASLLKNRVGRKHCQRRLWNLQPNSDVQCNLITTVRDCNAFYHPLNLSSDC